MGNLLRNNGIALAMHSATSERLFKYLKRGIAFLHFAGAPAPDADADYCTPSWYGKTVWRMGAPRYPEELYLLCLAAQRLAFINSVTHPLVMCHTHHTDQAFARGRTILGDI